MGGHLCASGVTRRAWGLPWVHRRVRGDRFLGVSLKNWETSIK